MEFDSVISFRRSIRKFSNKPVATEELCELLHAGTLAPSSKNRQQWGFVVLRSELKDRIAQIICDAAASCEYASSSTAESCRVMREASALILVYQRISSGYLRGDLLSIGACIENICLKATAIGLGSLWICDIDCAEDEINKALGKTEPLLSAIAVGYADESPAQRPRLDIEKITEWM